MQLQIVKGGKLQVRYFKNQNHKKKPKLLALTFLAQKPLAD